MTGAELAALRKTAGLSQSDLARLAGIGRHAVSDWEGRLAVDRRAYAVVRIARVLDLPEEPVPVVLPPPDAEMHEDEARMRIAVSQAVGSLRTPAIVWENVICLCGARTRAGHHCRQKVEPGRTRCKFHGGQSTGPTTPECKARIGEAQRRRWAAVREEKKKGTGEVREVRDV